MKKDFAIKAKVWRWPGDAGWHFVTLDKVLSSSIRTEYPTGFIKVQAQIGNTIWNTSLFPHMINKKVTKQVEYLLCLNKKIRKIEDLYEGDAVNIRIKIIKS